MSERKENSWMKRYLNELFLFFFSIGAAYFISWNNTDLLWSFWITSLVVGYVSIFRTSIAPLRLLTTFNLTPGDIKNFWELPTNKKLLSIIFVLVFVAYSLFIVLFLSFHFLIFHLFLAYFLQITFPHPALTDIFAKPDGGQFYTSIQVIKTLLTSYWIIVLEKLIFDYKTKRESSSNQAAHLQHSFINEAFSFEGIKRPYVQVARIHITIFLLFALSAVETNQYLIYVMIFSLFFFPMSIIRKVKS